MTKKVEARKAFLINLLFVLAVVGLIYCFFKFFFWTTAPFLISFFFSVLLQKPLRWLDKKTKNKFHAGWSIILVLASILIIIGPLAMIISKLVSETISFLQQLIAQLADLPTFLAKVEEKLLNFLTFLPDKAYASATKSISQTFTELIQDFDLAKLGIDMSTISSGISSGISGVLSVAKNIPSVLIGIIVGIIAWIFFTKDYNRIVRFFQRQLPESKKNLPVEIKQVFSKTILKMIRAYAIIMLITFLELFLGFSILTLAGILRNSYFVLIAMAIAVFDILPVAGSGGILLPWAVIALIRGDVKKAVGLVIIYVVITIIRQYIEPKIVGSSLGVHPLVTLIGFYVGLKLFGFIGMFIVPLLLMTLKAFNDAGRIHLWKTVDRN